MSDISEKLRALTVDWNGKPMADGEPPRDGLHCKDLRDAADEIERLRFENANYRAVAGAINNDQVFADIKKEIRNAS